MAASDNGAVLVSALLIVLLVTLLGAVAITESLGGSHSAAVVRKHMQVLAAANAGARAAVASVEGQAATVTSQTQPLTCTSPTTNQYLMTTSPSGAANGASAASYSVYYDVFNSQPITAELNEIQANPSASMSSFSNFSSGGACSSSGPPPRYLHPREPELRGSLSSPRAAPLHRTSMGQAAALRKHLWSTCR